MTTPNVTSTVSAPTATLAAMITLPNGAITYAHTSPFAASLPNETEAQKVIRLATLGAPPGSTVTAVPVAQMLLPAMTVAELTILIKVQCTNLITAVASTSRQQNIAAFFSSGQGSPAQIAAYKSYIKWVNDMRTTCALEIKNTDVNYKTATWPTCPPDALDLVNSFNIVV